MSGLRVHPLGELLWSDERGWGMRPLEAAGLAGRPLGDLHVVSLRPGKVRGHHYHDGTEWLLVAGGPVEVAARGDDEGPVEVRTLDGDGPHLLEIPAGVRHAVRNTGTCIVHLVAFSDRAGRSTVRAPLADV